MDPYVIKQHVKWLKIVCEALFAPLLHYSFPPFYYSRATKLAIGQSQEQGRWHSWAGGWRVVGGFTFRTLMHQVAETTRLSNFNDDLGILQKLYKDFKTHETVCRVRVPCFHKCCFKFNKPLMVFLWSNSLYPPLTLSVEAGRLTATLLAATIEALAKGDLKSLCNLATSSWSACQSGYHYFKPSAMCYLQWKRK